MKKLSSLYKILQFQGLVASCRRCRRRKRAYRNTNSRFERWRRRESSSAGRQANQALARCHR